jgi:hypothetical protein
MMERFKDVFKKKPSKKKLKETVIDIVAGETASSSEVNGR